MSVNFGGGAGALIRAVASEVWEESWFLDLEERAKSEKEDFVERAGEGEGEGDRFEEEREKEDRRERPSSLEGDNEGPVVEEEDEGESLVLLNRGMKLLNPEEVLIQTSHEGRERGGKRREGVRVVGQTRRPPLPRCSFACGGWDEAASLSSFHCFPCFSPSQTLLDSQKNGQP